LVPKTVGLAVMDSMGATVGLAVAVGVAFVVGMAETSRVGTGLVGTAVGASVAKRRRIMVGAKVAGTGVPATRVKVTV
jgi:hypothetical protein